MSQNPIRVIRKANGKTLEDFAGECHVHYQALFLNENGVYPHILPSIRKHLYYLGYLPLVLDADYRIYQREKRQTSGVQFCLGAVVLEAPSPVHPVVAFRTNLVLSRMAFCKRFCIQPSEMYELEQGKKHTFSEQFKQAMNEAGLPAIVLDELEYRCGEFADNEWVSGREDLNGRAG